MDSLKRIHNDNQTTEKYSQSLIFEGYFPIHTTNNCSKVPIESSSPLDQIFKTLDAWLFPRLSLLSSSYKTPDR